MKAFRATVWFAKGFFQFTNCGYDKASKDFIKTDLEVDLSNKSIMITGANSGIGKQAAFQLAKRGANVLMVCRSKERGEAALNELKQKSGNKNIQLFIVDMSQPKEVYKFAKKFVENNHKLDILVNNAGCMVNQRQFVQGNIQVNFATNTLGTHILTKTLLPQLAKSESPRVFIVTSGGALTQKLDYQDLMHSEMEQFDGTVVYAQNKRQQIVMVDSYSKNYPKIYFATMHPGWADTPGVQTSMPAFWEKMKNYLRTVEQGADTLVWMCCFKDLQKKFANGTFFQDRNQANKHVFGFRTKSDPEEEQVFMKKIDQLYEIYGK